MLQISNYRSVELLVLKTQLYQLGMWRIPVILLLGGLM